MTIQNVLLTIKTIAIFIFELNYNFYILIWEGISKFIKIIIYICYCTWAIVQLIYNTVYFMIYLLIRLENIFKMLIKRILLNPDLSVIQDQLDLIDIVVWFSLALFLFKFRDHIKCTVWSMLKRLLQTFRMSRDPQTQENGQQKHHPDKKSDFSCCICLIQNKNIVLFPCKHMATCDGCYESMRSINYSKCPVCRSPIESIIKIFTWYVYMW